MLPWCIDTSCDLGIFTLETYYSNLIASQLYAQKCLKYTKGHYWRPGRIYRGIYFNVGSVQIVYSSVIFPIDVAKNDVFQTYNLNKLSCSNFKLLHPPSNQIKSFIFESKLDGLQIMDKDIIRNKKKGDRDVYMSKMFIGLHVYDRHVSLFILTLSPIDYNSFVKQILLTFYKQLRTVYF